MFPNYFKIGPIHDIKRHTYSCTVVSHKVDKAAIIFKNGETNQINIPKAARKW